MCPAQLKHANRWIPFYLFVWFSLCTHLSFQILFLHLAALPMPCATWHQSNLLGAILIAVGCSNEECGWTSACTQQCQHHDSPSPENSNLVPREFKQPSQLMSSAICPVQDTHLSLSLPERSKSWQVRNQRGRILSEPHKICSWFACRKIAKCYFSNFAPPITDASPYVLISLLCSPQAWHVPKGPWGETLTACWRGGNKCIKETV